MSEEIKIRDVNKAESGAELIELNTDKETLGNRAEGTDESVQLCAARKIMREYSETLKLLADS